MSTSSRSDAQGLMPDQNLLRLLLPADKLEARMIACVAAVRLLLMPGATLLMVRALAMLGLLPRDPVCTMSLLVQVSTLWHGRW
jgi:hypothetical protein